MVKADLWHEIHSRFKLKETKKEIARALSLASGPFASSSGRRRPSLMSVNSKGVGSWRASRIGSGGGWRRSAIAPCLFMRSFGPMAIGAVTMS
jgi:hypothetical protein